MDAEVRDRVGVPLRLRARRLAKRYLWGNPRFLVAAAREPGLRKGGRQ